MGVLDICTITVSHPPSLLLKLFSQIPSYFHVVMCVNVCVCMRFCLCLCYVLLCVCVFVCTCAYGHVCVCVLDVSLSTKYSTVTYSLQFDKL